MKQNLGRKGEANPLSDYIAVKQGSAPYQNSLAVEKMASCQSKLAHNRRSCSPNIELSK